MFTGIIECTGEVVDVNPQKDNLEFQIKSIISQELKVDQSVSHNGVCLTVTKVSNDTHWVTAVQETLVKSSLGALDKGNRVNLERSMKLGARLDGHIVQGHVDQVAAVVGINEQGGSWQYDFAYQADGQAGMMVEKGSITVDGVSLTCFNVTKGGFSVAIIPYTYSHTTFSAMKLGSKVNLEFDVIGKYVAKMLESRNL
ncbi:MAG: riboflavin synthase [Flavobacteriales bacterium]|nr:riboflavin synthase [Flavobacteriales bacterium]